MNGRVVGRADVAQSHELDQLEQLLRRTAQSDLALVPTSGELKPREGGDPRNPMQGVKIYFREPWYFIHGTNKPGSIGSAASHGCLRMRTKDAKALARMISKHRSVVLIIEP